MYIYSLEPNKIKQLYDDIRSNGWEINSIVQIENSAELLCCFEMFYYFNDCLPSTNGLLPVADGETQVNAEKIFLKYLYEFCKDTKLHGLVTLQFLLALNFF